MSHVVHQNSHALIDGISPISKLDGCRLATCMLVHIAYIYIELGGSGSVYIEYIVVYRIYTCMCGIYKYISVVVRVYSV